MARPFHPDLAGQALVVAALARLHASERRPATIRQVAETTGRTIRATTIALSNAWCLRKVRRRTDPSFHGARARLLYWLGPGRGGL